ncbi:cell envelope biogenesis protein OmpA [Bradyrhizobium guangzhouense]|uniref:Cell envelope biogenesis protein OmpA n=1 Tax=Bradyrhizobium guangzhouense TaxID=1325095 RepID=A0AAE5WWX2_9BRAD|nr:cell envelope biogenesis protein OmpA [Bradyrhizobium guangzhouense]RXH08952.1 cell envelope biogenesis protein OmpA [Bradyrhizobium guangzhouense]
MKSRRNEFISFDRVTSQDPDDRTAAIRQGCRGGEVTFASLGACVLTLRSHRCRYLRTAAALASGVLVLPAAGLAADLPLKARAAKTVYDWTGFYVGGHVGYGDAGFGPGTNPLPEQGALLPHSATGFSGGYQLGYNRQLANGVVLGIEADSTFTAPTDGPALARSPAPFNTTIDYVGTVRGRVGYAFDRFMPYVTGGVAWGHTHINVNDTDGVTPLFPVGHYQAGWTAGLGLEYAVSGNWTAKAEYEYVDLSRKSYDLSGFGLGSVNVDPRIHLFKLGLNYQFGDTPWMPAVGKPKLPESDDWNVHAQTTLLPQGYGPIHSPYASPQSLPGRGQFQATWTTTAFLGARLWDGGEIYFDPELAQGFGLNGTLGLAGFSNGEAQKAGAPFPKIRAQRYYLKQTFGLGGEQEAVEDGPNQLAGKHDVDRVTLIVGRFAVGDFFDGNSYAKDPRADFMNWAMWSSAAYDFPADLPGYTRGGVVELNRKDWAIRAGLFQVPSAPNSDLLTFKTGGSVVEFEERHTLLEQPGKLRIGVFANSGNTANYREVVDLAAANPALDINTITTADQRTRLKYGFYVNLEQQIVNDVGLFARASWNDGQNQILSFTDIDRSLSGGLSIKGSHWGRPDDTVGIGGAINALSSAHRDFLAAGGTGLLIGDGQLNYRTERILEAYYAYSVIKGVTLTGDYQLITNPAYNADRGPVSIFSGRLHAEF